MNALRVRDGRERVGVEVGDDVRAIFAREVLGRIAFDM